MKVIQTKNHQVQLDDEDYKLLIHAHLYVFKGRISNHVKFTGLDYINKNLARFILNETTKDIIFKDGNFLNCQKANLQIVQRGQQRWRKANINYYNKNKHKESFKIMRKVCCKEYSSRFSSRFIAAKKMAERRNLEWKLTFDQYVEFLNKPCYYTGQKLNPTGSGLDRIDNYKGYTIDNVLPCIGWVNKLRQNFLSVEETKVAVNAILEYRKNKETTTEAVVAEVVTEGEK